MNFKSNKKKKNFIKREWKVATNHNLQASQSCIWCNLMSSTTHIKTGSPHKGTIGGEKDLFSYRLQRPQIYHWLLAFYLGRGRTIYVSKCVVFAHVVTKCLCFIKMKNFEKILFPTVDKIWYFLLLASTYLLLLRVSFEQNVN